MNFYLLFYYILFNIFIFGIIPDNSLVFVRPIFIIIVSFLFIILSKFNNKIVSKIVIILLNFASCIIIKEFSRINTPLFYILLSFTYLILILLFFNNKIKYLGFVLLFLLFVFLFYHGRQFSYQSEEYIEKKNLGINIYEYGVNEKIKSNYTDASSYYKGNSGLAQWYDEEYWNINNRLPLNGRFSIPNKEGKFPIVFIVHGNALAENPSHIGYDYLINYLVKNGFIAVSIDENFLNGNWTTLGVGQPYENDARGRLIIEHIKLFEKWNNDKTSILYNKVDINNIGLIGHSRGGEAISIAAKYSKKFPIKALMVLAGTDNQYKERILLKDISYITLQGANDGDITSFDSRAQFNRISFNPHKYNFKASYYLEGVNHSQFNTEWGLVDSTGIGKLFYTKKSNITAEDQRKITKEIGLKFFNATLKKINAEIQYLKTPEKILNLPQITYLTDFYDSDNLEFKNKLKIDNGIMNIQLQDNDKVYEINYNSLTKIIQKKSINEKPSSINLSIATINSNPILLEATLYNNSKVVLKKSIKLKEPIIKHIYKSDYIFNLEKIDPQFQRYTISLPKDIKWEELQIKFNSKIDDSILISNISYTTSYQKKE